jgi:RNA polymerase sigma-70 factor (ECF subfamily)
LDPATLDGNVRDTSDEELMTLLRAGDSKALEMLFARHSKLVHSIALRVLRDAGEADEVVQECFLYLYRKPLVFEPSRGSAKVWIVQIAYSRARDRKAQLSRRGYYIHKDVESPELEDTLTGLENAESEIEARLDFGRLQSAFDDLTTVQRETLELYYFEEMGLREISERLHEPFGNVRHHFYRGLERLRKSAIIESVRDRHNGKEKGQRRS